MHATRLPVCAGLFYPDDARELERNVRSLLSEAPHCALVPKALIVPHAGYIYSGAIAASAYTTLQPIAGTIRRVVLLGPAHRVLVHGLALPDVDAFETPLGSVPLDTLAVEAIKSLPQVIINGQAHAREHALEVQLPFLQCMLQDFTILPLLVGRALDNAVAEVLDGLWNGDETLIIVSSDLSHYLPYVAAQQVDRKTIDSILALRAQIDPEQACGSIPVGGLIISARKHNLSPHLLDLRNSGDTAGSRDQVVGYAAIAFTEEGRYAN